MKALSILQPWAWLIVNGHKDVENRGWRTSFRGRILVHAGKGMDWNAMDIPLVERALRECGELAGMERGGIVGEVEIVTCVQRSQSPWFCGPYGFVLRGARPLPFRPLRGRLGLFDVPDALL